jgi:hypothetical protein
MTVAAWSSTRRLRQHLLASPIFGIAGQCFKTEEFELAGGKQAFVQAHVDNAVILL